MARKALVEILGNAAGYKMAVNESLKATKQLDVGLKRLSVDAKASADAQVAASVRKTERLRKEVTAYREIAGASRRGSQEQITAARLAANAQAKLSRSMGVSAVESRRLAESSQRIERNFGRVTRGAVAGSGVFRSLGRSIALVSGAYIGSAGLVYGIQSAIKTSSQFENSLDKIVGLAGGSRSSLKHFRTELLALGPAVGKTPTELAEALYFIASSGIKASQQMGVLKVSAQASAAGLGETKTVADALTSAMNAYGAGNLSAAKASDVLVATVKEGKGEASDFAPVIGNVAALAAQLGVSFNEVGAALAAQTRLGVSAQTSSVQLQSFFSALVKTGPQAEKAMKSVGLSSAGLRQELKEKGLLATLKTLKEHFGGNTVAMAKAFPNLRAIRGLLALIGKQSNETVGVFERMGDVGGARMHALRAVSEDADFQFQRFKAAVQAASITVGAALAPSLGRAAAGIANYLGKTKNQRMIQREVNSAMRTTGAVLHGVLAVVRPLAKTVMALTHALGGAKTVAKLLATAFIGMKILKWAGQFRVLAGSIRGVAIAEGEAGLGAGLGGLLKGAGRKLALAAAIRGGIAGGAVALGTAGAAGALGVAGVVLSAGGATEQHGDRSKKYPRMAALIAKAADGAKLTPNEQLALSMLGSHSFANASDADLSKAEQFLKRSVRGSAAGANVSDRQPGGSPRGAAPGAHTAGAAADVRHRAGRGDGGGGGTHAGPLGFNARFANQELLLAQAGLTRGQGDDRRVLAREAEMIRKRIGTLPRDRKHLQERTQLYQQLAQVQQQIQSIDEDAANKKKQANEKQLSLKKKEREQEKKHSEKMKEQLQKQKEAMQEAVSNARSQMGELFSGPLLNPSESQNKHTLGLSGPNAMTLTKDVIGQTRQFRQETRDLGVLRRSGASKQVLGELEGVDPEQLHALATATPKERKAFLKAFAQREKAIQARARFDIHTPHLRVHAKTIDIGGEIHVTIHTQTNLDGKKVAETVTAHQQRHDRRNGAQRTGRHPGRAR